MATEGFSNDSFPSPSPAAGTGAAAFSCDCDGDCACGGGGAGGDAGSAGPPGCVDGAGGRAECAATRGCVGFAGGETWGGAGASCARRGEARLHGLDGIGGLRCCVPAEEVEDADAALVPARRCSCGALFAAGDGDLRAGRSPASRCRRGGGGGEGDARPLPGRPAPGPAAAPRSRLARATSPDAAATRLLGFAGDRSGPAAVVAADDSDAASDLDSLKACAALWLRALL